MVGSALLIPEAEIAVTRVPANISVPERVVVKLHGRPDDVRSVAARLRIDLEWDRAARQPGDVCSVEGSLAAAEPQQLSL